MTHAVPAHTRRVIAVRAAVDTRTVDRYLARADIRSTTTVRIEAALRELGLSHLIPGDGTEQGGALDAP